jgi:cytosine deaminase
LSNHDWLLRNARISDDGPLVDMALQGERIVRMASNLEGTAQQERDLGGRVVMPGFVDVHVHLDKTLTLERVGNASGTLLEAIERWVAFKPQLTRTDYVERASRGLEMAVLNGTTAMRTHVDVDANGFTALEAVLEVREHYRDAISLEVVALGGPGLGGQELQAMETALELGADLIGGCPAIRPDGRAEIAAALGLAERTGKCVDLHVDENENPDSRWLEVLSDEVIARGLEGLVTAGHCCSLDFMDQSTADRVMDRVAQARIDVVALPACNLNLQGRRRHPVPRGVTRIKELLRRGVNVCVGSDNVQDPFHPVGHYDLLGAAQLTVMVAHMTGPSEMLETLEMVSSRPAHTMGLENHTIAEGSRANFTVLDATSRISCLTVSPRRIAAFRNGKLVSSSSGTTSLMGQEVSRWTF